MSVPGRVARDRATAAHPDLCRVTGEPLDPEEHLAAVRRAGTGAEVLFAGVVRDHDAGRAISSLRYVAHPSAARVLRECRDEVAADPLVRAVAVSHRTGDLDIGDAALVVAVSGADRAAAFTACARLVDLVKERLPVWRHQVFRDGTGEWVHRA